MKKGMEKNLLIVSVVLFLLFNVLFVGADLETCVDLEGEKNFFVKGIVRWNDFNPEAVVPIRTREDICFNETILYEVYCDENIVTKEMYPCPSPSVCKEGICSFACSSIGFRTEEMYCSGEGIFEPQKEKDAEGNWESCNNHYECKSNVCIEGECVHPSFIRRAIEWIKNLFGS